MELQNQVWRILLIEDNEDACLLIRDLLSRISLSTVELHWVVDHDSALEAIGRGGYDLSLLGCRPSECTGSEIVRKLTAFENRAPVILLTECEDPSVHLSAIDAGAADCLVKSEITAALLERSIRYAMERRRREDELAECRKHFEELIKEQTSELRRAQGEAVRRATELDAALGAIAEGVVIFGPDRKPVRINSMASFLLQWSPEGEERSLEELLTSLWAKDEDGRSAVLEELPVMRAYEGEVVSSRVLSIDPSPSHRPRWIACSAAPIRSRDGKITGVAATFTDITRQWLLTGKLQKARDELELRVRQRTAQIEDANQALRDEIAEREKAEKALRESEARLRHLSSRLLSAQEEERKRIAGELHDSIGASLGAIKMSLENLLREVGEDSGSAQAIQNLIAHTQQTVDEARRIMTALRPSMLDDLGLITTLASFCKSFRAIHPEIFIEEMIEADERHIPEDLKIVIFRVVQEAFHNISKYSHAEFVELSLKKIDRTLNLTIEDSGEGFDLEAALSRADHEKGLGLTSMRERVELSGGAFSIESTPGEGTWILASWTLADATDRTPVEDPTADGTLQKQFALYAATLEGIIPEKAARLIRNLEAHQVELKMQQEELRRAKEDAEASREKCRRLIDGMPTGLLTLDRLGVIAEVNLAATKKLQGEKVDLVGRQLHSWIAPVDRDLLHLHLKNVFETRAPQTCTLRLKRDGDSECSIKLDSLIVGDQAGENLCATAITDVTPCPQRPYELGGFEKPENWLDSVLQALVSSQFKGGRDRELHHGIEWMLQLVMNNIPQFIFWKDRSSVYLGCNSNFAKAAGVGSPEEIVGKTDYDLAWRREEADFFRECDRRVMENDRAEYHIIEPQRHADGKQAWVDTNKIPLHDDRGRVIGILGTYEDITERKQAEEELRKAKEALELRVQERTAELKSANEELKKVPLRLIEAQEEERRRLAGELHDSISQTLAALKFGIETVIITRDGGDCEGALMHLDRFVPILQRSIEETRAIYMGLRPTVLEDMGLIAALHWFIREFHELYPQHHVELEVDVYERNVPEPLKTTIFRITQEALTNVAKHSKAEWVDLVLATNGKQIELTIADDGVGMDVDHILQSDSARTIGLTSMWERAELTGGTFSIESTMGEGTTVRASWLLQEA